MVKVAKVAKVGKVVKLKLNTGLLAITLLAGAVSITGCENMQNKDVGMIAGGAGGALVGSQFGGGSGQLYTTAAGAILGAMLGGSVGSKMDELDKMRAEQAYQQAANSPMGQSISWQNPHSGHHGSVRPVREGRAASGDYCREFQTNAFIDGRKETVYSTACKGKDGRWYTSN